MLLVTFAILLGLLIARKVNYEWRKLEGKGQPGVYVVIPLLLLLIAGLLNQYVGLAKGYLEPGFKPTHAYPLRGFQEGLGLKGRVTHRLYSFQYQTRAGDWVMRTSFADEAQAMYTTDAQIAEYQKGYSTLVFSDSAPDWARYVFFQARYISGPTERIILPDGKS